MDLFKAFDMKAKKNKRKELGRFFHQKNCLYRYIFIDLFLLVRNITAIPSRGTGRNAEDTGNKKVYFSGGGG